MNWSRHRIAGTKLNLAASINGYYVENGTWRERGGERERERGEVSERDRQREARRERESVCVWSKTMPMLLYSIRRGRRDWR